AGDGDPHGPAGGGKQARLRAAAGCRQLLLRRHRHALHLHGGAPAPAGGRAAGRQREHRLMPIVVNLDVMLARRKMRSKDLAEAIGLSETNLSLLKQGRVKGVRFATLEAICRELECTPGDLLEYRPES